MNASFECIEKHLYRRRRVIDAVLRYFHRLEKEAARVPAWIRSRDIVPPRRGATRWQSRKFWHNKRGANKFFGTSAIKEFTVQCE